MRKILGISLALAAMATAAPSVVTETRDVKSGQFSPELVALIRKEMGLGAEKRVSLEESAINKRDCYFDAGQGTWWCD